MDTDNSNTLRDRVHKAAMPNARAAFLKHFWQHHFAEATSHDDFPHASCLDDGVHGQRYVTWQRSGFGRPLNLSVCLFLGHSRRAQYKNKLLETILRGAEGSTPRFGRNARRLLTPRSPSLPQPCPALSFRSLRASVQMEFPSHSASAATRPSVRTARPLSRMAGRTRLSRRTSAARAGPAQRTSRSSLCL